MQTRASEVSVIMFEQAKKTQQPAPLVLRRDAEMWIELQEKQEIMACRSIVTITSLVLLSLRKSASAG